MVSWARAIGSAWLGVGLVLLSWSIVGLCQWWQTASRFSGPRNAMLIFAGAAAAAVLGGILTLCRKSMGKVVLLVLSALVFLYAAAYLLMGGFDDTGGVYLLCVVSLTFLSLVTVLLRRRLARG
jgi:hypothetical protein